VTWQLTSFGKTRIALPGVKWADLTDEEYAAAVARHPGMEEQGYFVKVEETLTRQGRPSHGTHFTIPESGATPAASMTIADPPASPAAEKKDVSDG